MAENAAMHAAMHDSDASPESRAAARQELIHRNIPLVLNVLRGKERYWPQCDPEDVYGYGFLALARLIDAYDPAKGALSTIARKWILGSVHTFVRDSEFRIKVPAHFKSRENGHRGIRDHKTEGGRERNECITRLANIARGATNMSLYIQAEHKPLQIPARDENEPGPPPQAIRDVAEVLSSLDPDDADIIRRYFGIGCERQTLQEIGEGRGEAFGKINGRYRSIINSLRRSFAA